MSTEPENNDTHFKHHDQYALISYIIIIMLTSGNVLVMVLVTCTFLVDLVCDDTCVVFLEEDIL